MKRHRAVLVVVLLYVGLDFAFPDMPGAFVFDPAGSVESTDVARARLAAKIVIPTPAPFAFPPAQQPDNELNDRLPPSSTAVPYRRPVVNCLARATCAPSAPTEDSH
jgi:hypothetical protein